MYYEIVKFLKEREEKMEVKIYDFKWEKFIGKGNFGKVYLCYDKNEW